MNLLEEMYLPCPDDICDGSGMVFDEDTSREEPCPHVKDPYAVEPLNL